MKAKIHAYAFATAFMFAGAASAAEQEQHGAVSADTKAGKGAVTQDLNQLPATAAGVELTAKARAEQRRERFERRLGESLEGNASVFGAGL